MKDKSSSLREERPMRKLSGSWWRDVWESVSFVREFREARAVARLLSTSGRYNYFVSFCKIKIHLLVD